MAGSSCNGPKAAVQDFFDPYRIAVGAGSGAGVRVNSLGLIHTGLMFGVKPQSLALGWKYGHAMAFQPSKTGDIGAEVDQAVIYKTETVFDLNYNRGSYDMARRSFFLLPAIFSWVDSADANGVAWLVPDEGVALEGETWLWDSRSWSDNRKAQVHAFDIEAEVMIGVYLDVGFSPGEVLDFWTSLFGYDLAKDDDR